MDDEPILDPSIEICDPHHHLMDHEPWHYLRDDLLADLASGHRVVSTVYIECGSWYRTDGPEHLRPVGEVEYVLAQDVPPGVMAGIVAHADLRLGDGVEEVLDAAASVAGTRLGGIRFMTAWDPAPELCLLPMQPTPGLLADPTVIRAAACVGRRGLALDCWVYHHQLGDVVALARALPDQIIVLDHLGTPVTWGPYASHPEEVFSTWRTSMRDVAACHNVVLKVGGLAMDLVGSADGRPPSSQDLASRWSDDVHWCIDLFGPERSMFESNFPIDRRTISYAALWNAFKIMSARYGPAERAALFHDTAERTYHLDS